MLTEIEAQCRLRMSRDSFYRLRKAFCIMPDDYRGHTPLYDRHTVSKMAEFQKVIAEVGHADRSRRATETVKILRRKKAKPWSIIK